MTFGRLSADPFTNSTYSPGEFLRDAGFVGRRFPLTGHCVWRSEQASSRRKLHYFESGANNPSEGQKQCVNTGRFSPVSADRGVYAF
jgi:hypothetical protein